MAVCALLAPGAAFAASGDWEMFVNASAINRIDCVGDSIWCSTRGGILVFNLVDSSFVQHLDGLGFRSTDVSGVTRDNQGSVWASFTTSGVARIDRFGSAEPSVKLYTATIDGLMSDSVTCIASAGDDVYYGSTGGIAKFYDNLHSFEPVLSDSLEGVPVRDLLARGDTLWVACERGVARFLRSTFNYTMYRHRDATSLCAHGGAIHVAGANGVQRFDGSAWVSLGRPDGSDSPRGRLGRGHALLRHRARAYRRDGSSWTDITANMKTLFSQKYYIWSGDSIFSKRSPSILAAPYGSPELEAQIDRGAYLSAYFRMRGSTRRPRVSPRTGSSRSASFPGRESGRARGTSVSATGRTAGVGRPTRSCGRRRIEAGLSYLSEQHRAAPRFAGVPVVLRLSRSRPHQDQRSRSIKARRRMGRITR